MTILFYKFCYWIGVKLEIHKLSAWAYIKWFMAAGADDILLFFKFSEGYFKFCKKWEIGR